MPVLPRYHARYVSVVTGDVFLQNFPELTRVGSVLIAAKLAIAAAKMGGPAVNPWGPLAAQGAPPTIADAAHGFLAAALIWESPNGGATLLPSMKPGGAKNRYRLEFEEIETALCTGGIVAGGCWPQAPGLSIALGLTPGNGTVALVQGASTVTFANPQTFAAGTLFVFTSTQPGVYYALQVALTGGTVGQLSAAYSGLSAPTAQWSY